MKRAQYIRELDIAIESIPEPNRGEIIADYEKHFEKKLIQGEREHDICVELGSSKKLAKQIIEDYEKSLEEAAAIQSMPKESVIIKVLTSFFKNLLAFLTVLQSITISLFESIKKVKGVLLESLKKLVASFKAMLVVCSKQLKSLLTRIQEAIKKVNMPKQIRAVIIGLVSTIVIIILAVLGTNASDSLLDKNARMPLPTSTSSSLKHEQGKTNGKGGSKTEVEAPEEKKLPATKLEKEFSTDKMHKINIHTTHIDVKLFSIAGDGLKVYLYRTSNTLKGLNALDFSLVQAEGTLHIIANTGNFTALRYNDIRLDLAVPEKLFKKIKVQTDSGTLSVSGVHAESVELQSNLGTVSLANITGDVHIISQLGLVTGKMIEGNMHVKTYGADTSLQLASIHHDIHIETYSGKVAVGVVTVPTSLDLYFKSKEGRSEVVSVPVDFSIKSPHILQGAIGKEENSLHVLTNTGNFRFSHN